MKTKLVLFVVLVGLTACQKIKGDKGDKGDPGPGHVRIYAGSIPGDDFTISLFENPNDIQQVTVYIHDANWAELPYYIPALGVNAFDLYKPSGSSAAVQFVNCQSAGATTWQIVLITK